MELLRISSFIILTVLVVHTAALTSSPEITEPPINTAAVIGTTVTLKCRVSGAPKPLVKWIRNGLELTGHRYTVLDNGDLQIRNVNFLDTAQYTCNAENNLGTAIALGELAVKEHTRILYELDDYEAIAGFEANFRCSAISDSSLPLTIEWLHNGDPIDFNSAQRFAMSSDFTLSISQVTELDSGNYTCRAKTDLDEASAQATLSVRDVPNAPELIGVVCRERDALLTWKPMGDNGTPITHYVIQFNTSFTPDTWTVVAGHVPAADTTYTVHMSPWSNYTFRVIAQNRIGPSVPSHHSQVCTTKPDVPYKNPDHVEGRGTEPYNIVIRWTPMPEIEHNAPRFKYSVYWKRDAPGEEWSYAYIEDWERSEYIIPNQPFQKYRIKVVALNERGEANVVPKETDGYSTEDKPTQAPTNFTLLQVVGSNSALLSWNPVPPESVQGHFKGYKIQIWTDKDGEAGMQEIRVRGDATRTRVNTFIPNSKNYARVLAYNGRYNGPTSEVLEFDTPEGVPGPVSQLDAYQVGSSALYLVWEPPQLANGILTGYRIYFQRVEGTQLGPTVERLPQVSDPLHTRAKVAGLETDAKYRLMVAATTRAGEGDHYIIERRLRSRLAVKPDVPQFKLVRNDNASVKVVLLPSLDGNPGSDFFVKYRQKGETMYNKTPLERLEDFTIVRGLMPDQVYEFQIVAVDGDYTTESAPQDVDTHSVV